jgi:sodium-independent sulfate anion transporter 11
MPGKLRSVGHSLAKPLGIKLNYRNEIGQAQVTRGESILTQASAESYVEEEPTSWEWICETIPSLKDIGHYLAGLFPFLQWIFHYNGQWLFGDLVAGEIRPSSVASRGKL